MTEHWRLWGGWAGAATRPKSDSHMKWRLKSTPLGYTIQQLNALCVQHVLLNECIYSTCMEAVHRMPSWVHARPSLHGNPLGSRVQSGYMCCNVLKGNYDCPCQSPRPCQNVAATVMRAGLLWPQLSQLHKNVAAYILGHPIQC